VVVNILAVLPPLDMMVSHKLHMQTVLSFGFTLKYFHAILGAIIAPVTIRAAVSW
jgi:hypothetical protein